jgi:hypothetical protein
VALDADTIPTRPLGAVHDLVCPVGQGVGGPTIVGEGDDADRDGRAEDVRPGVEPDGCHRSAQLLGHHGRALGVGFRQEHDELVATVSRGGVDDADALPDRFATACSIRSPK